MKTKKPLRYKYLIGTKGIFWTILFTSLTAIFGYLQGNTQGSWKIAFIIMAIGFAFFTVTVAELRKSASSWEKDIYLEESNNLLKQRESQLDNIYNRPIWTLKDDILKQINNIRNNEEPSRLLEDYIKDMTIACQEIISQGHKHTDQVRVTVYEYDRSPKNQTDGNDSGEISSKSEEPILTLKRFHGRTSDNPRRHFRMYKNNGEIDPYGKYTLDTLLTKEGSERELFYPDLLKNPIEGFRAENFKNKRYRGFYSIPIIKENSKDLIGMLSVDCTEDGCLKNISKPMMRHLAAMISLGFIDIYDKTDTTESNLGTVKGASSVRIQKPTNLKERKYPEYII